MKTEGLSDAEINAKHAEKMRRKKEARDKIIATKTIEKGLLIVHTGNGKGKSSSAFGRSGRSSVTSGGASESLANITAASEGFGYGTTPVRHSYSTAASE